MSLILVLLHSLKAALATWPSYHSLACFSTAFKVSRGPTISNSLPNSTPMLQPSLSWCNEKLPTIGMLLGILLFFVMAILQPSFDANLFFPVGVKNNLPPDVIAAPGQCGIESRSAGRVHWAYSCSFHSKLISGIKPGLPTGKNMALSTTRPAGSTVSWAKSFPESNYGTLLPRWQSHIYARVSTKETWIYYDPLIAISISPSDLIKLLTNHLNLSLTSEIGGHHPLA